MASGLQNATDLVDKGFWGGFVKGFKKISARKKRNTDNKTTTETTDSVQIDTVIMMADPTNKTDLEKLETAITNAPNLTAVSGSIKGIN